MEKSIRTEYFSLKNITAYFPEYDTVVVWQREGKDLDRVMVYLNKVDVICLGINLEHPDRHSPYLRIEVNSISDVHTKKYSSVSDFTPNIMHEPLAEARYQYDRIIRPNPEKRKSLFGIIGRLGVARKIKR
jgi:hypothetical protein